MKLLSSNKDYSRTKEKASFFSKLSLLSSKGSIGESKLSVERSDKRKESRPSM